VSFPAIEIEGLTKDYPVGFWRKRPHRALDGLTLRVEEGDVFGFLGPNGAGKSTTLKLLMALIFPTSGTARILGRPIHDVRMHRDIGYLPEQPYFYDYLTGRELLDYFARLFDYGPQERRDRIRNLLDNVGLSSAGDLQLRKYSKGMLQRIGIAQAILNDPKVVFLDEPMSGLDPVGRREVRDIILELKQQGRTVLFSTHILSDAEALCDRVAILLNGKLEGVGSLDQIMPIHVQGMEILFEPGPGRDLPSILSGTATRTGSHYHIVVREAELYATIEQLHRCEARIITVTQLKPTLEEFFFRLVGRERPSPDEVEVAGR
jgi:ABC-2 type transport system ATP-binding protein